MQGWLVGSELAPRLLDVVVLLGVARTQWQRAPSVAIDGAQFFATTIVNLDGLRAQILPPCTSQQSLPSAFEIASSSKRCSSSSRSPPTR